MRICETCGEEFVPTHYRVTECPACRIYLATPESKDATVRWCLKCGVQVVGEGHFCRTCRARNREVQEVYGPAALGVSGMTAI
jgi:hypothetical protein